MSTATMKVIFSIILFATPSLVLCQTEAPTIPPPAPAVLDTTSITTSTGEELPQSVTALFEPLPVNETFTQEIESEVANVCGEGGGIGTVPTNTNSATGYNGCFNRTADGASGACLLQFVSSLSGVSQVSMLCWPLLNFSSHKLNSCMYQYKK